MLAKIMQIRGFWALFGLGDGGRAGGAGGEGEQGGREE